MAKVFCECNSTSCFCQVEIPDKDYLKIVNARLVVIAENCSHGPDPTDTLVERHDQFSTYREMDSPPSQRREEPHITKRCYVCDASIDYSSNRCPRCNARV